MKTPLPQFGQHLLAFGLGAMVVGGAMYVRAGDVNPPPGPIGPSMHTLDDIYAKVSASPCESCGWQYRYIASNAITTIPGPMRLRSVTQTFGYAVLYDAANAAEMVDANIVAIIGSGGSQNTTVVVPCDIPITKGLTVRQFSGGCAGVYFTSP